MKSYNKYKILQQDKTDCGIACISCIMKYYGRERKLEDLRSLSGTNEYGTSLLGLYQCCKEIGFIPKAVSCNISDLKKNKKPIIIHTTCNNTFHYIVILKYNLKSEKFIINDPAKGIICVKEKYLSKIWSGACLFLETSDDFYTKNKVLKTDRLNKTKFLTSILKKDLSFLILGLLIGICSTVLSLATPIFTQKLIDDIFPSFNKFEFYIAFLLFSLVIGINAFISFIRETILSIQDEQFNKHIFSFFIRSIITQPKLFFTSRRTGDFTARLNDLSKTQRIISTFIVNYTLDILSLIFAIAYILILNYKIGFFFLILIPVFFYIFKKHKKLLLGQKEQAIAYSFLESGFISTFRNMSNIKYDRLEKYFIEKNIINSNSYQQKRFVLRKISINLGVSAGLITSLLFLSIIFFTATSVFNGTMTVGYMISSLGILGIAISAFNNLSLICIPLSELKISFNRMYDIIKEEKEPSIETIDIENIDKISLKNISFHYPNSIPLYNNLSFEINRNQKIIIAGKSGCGKSTLIDILSGNIKPQEGNILINGINLESINHNSISNLIRVVPQDITIYENSILWNITLSDSIDIETFIDKYNINFLLDILPEITTLVGESGITLSKGQKQAIGIMRAIYKEPQVLILDEPTSALDPLNSKKIYCLLDILNTLYNTTILIISHDEKILTQKNHIFVLEDGNLKQKH